MTQLIQKAAGKFSVVVIFKIILQRGTGYRISGHSVLLPSAC